MIAVFIAYLRFAVANSSVALAKYLYRVPGNGLRLVAQTYPFVSDVGLIGLQLGRASSSTISV